MVVSVVTATLRKCKLSSESVMDTTVTHHTVRPQNMTLKGLGYYSIRVRKSLSVTHFYNFIPTIFHFNAERDENNENTKGGGGNLYIIVNLYIFFLALQTFNGKFIFSLFIFEK